MAVRYRYRHVPKMLIDIRCSVNSPRHPHEQPPINPSRNGKQANRAFIAYGKDDSSLRKGQNTHVGSRPEPKMRSGLPRCYNLGKRRAKKAIICAAFIKLTAPGKKYSGASTR